MTIGLYLVYGTYLSPLWCWLPIGWMGANTESWYGGQKGVWLGESFLLRLGDLNRWVGRKEFMGGLQETFAGEAWQSLAAIVHQRPSANLLSSRR
jgi:hypothetical protein